MKIEEVLKALTEKQHIVAVLEDVLGYLEEFLPSDVDLSPDQLRIEEGLCLDPIVSNKAIETVIDSISALVKAERAELKKINSMETKPNGRTRKPAARRKSPSKPAGNAKANKPARGKK